MTDEIKLKPCPFCGGKGEIARLGDRRQSTIYDCSECGCTLDTGEEFKHGTQWNQRVREYPAELTDDLREVLGMMVYHTGPVAHAFRAAGASIKPKCEEEQAYVLHWLIGLVLEHGADWRKHAADQLSAVKPAAA